MPPAVQRVSCSHQTEPKPAGSQAWDWQDGASVNGVFEPRGAGFREAWSVEGRGERFSQLADVVGSDELGVGACDNFRDAADIGRDQR